MIGLPYQVFSSQQSSKRQRVQLFIYVVHMYSLENIGILRHRSTDLLQRLITYN